MPTIVRSVDAFNKQLRRLARKYPQVLETVDKVIMELENDHRPGDKIPNVGYDVYKVRLENISAGRGKSGGFRVIYYVQLTDLVFLLSIYSKTEQTDIAPDAIASILRDTPPADTNNE